MMSVCWCRLRGISGQRPADLGYFVPQSPDMSSLIAYYRVSTQKQGRSGLGLEAQRKAVASFAEAEGFEIVAEFTEVETGKGSDALDRRPQLKAALKAAKKVQVLKLPWPSSTGSAVTSRSFQA